MDDIAGSAQVLLRWHDAVNAGEVEAAVAACTLEVAVTGPRGTATGHDVMRNWLQRSGIRLRPQDALSEVDGRFVVRERAHWTTAAAPDGAPLEPTDTWVVFTVAGGLVSSVARFETADDVPAA